MEANVRNLAEQANGEVFLRYGDTLVLATCVMSKFEKEGQGFFPLTVDYEEKYYAAGKIRGPRYIKRESRPSDEAICNSRLIDRTIRPLFPKDLNREVQVVATVLSWDGENDSDIVGLLAASISLSISDIPWSGPIGAVRVGRINNEFVLNPTYEQRERSQVDLIFGAVEKNNEILANMIEGSFEEVDEKLISDAWNFAKPHLKKVFDFQKEILKKAGKDKASLESQLIDNELQKEVGIFLKERLEKALYQKEKAYRVEQLENLKKDLSFFVEEKYPEGGKTKNALSFFEEEVERVLHENTISKGKRADGRDLDEIREISCEVGSYPERMAQGFFAEDKPKPFPF